METLRNLNILTHTPLPPPRVVKEELPMTELAAHTVVKGRKCTQQIIRREDPRLLMIVGPCSIHDPEAALEYAGRLKELQGHVESSMHILMRVYFEKPRTTVGWKGFINDPCLDGSFRIEEGLRRARTLLRDINELGVPVAAEALDPITPQYLDELIAWTAIGARTVESQTHRELASGLSTPIGFKNSTDGSFQAALNALKAVSQSHHFIGMNGDGVVSVFCTKGNQDAHIVLRGGKRPNYDSVSIGFCEEALAEHKLPKNIMVDCSHGNSMKRPELQPVVLRHCVSQILEGNQSIIGFMLESNLKAGKQSATAGAPLAYGVSITDSCISWEATAAALLETHERLNGRLAGRTC